MEIVNTTGFNFTSSEFKHDVSTEDIQNVIMNPKYSKQYPDRPVALLIGFDIAGKTIEVTHDTQTRTVFHTRPVSDAEKRIKQ